MLTKFRKTTAPIKSLPPIGPGEMPPSLRSVSPHYGALIDQYTALATERADLEREALDLSNQIAAGGNDSVDGTIEGRVAAVLDGTPAADFVSERKRYADVLQRVSDITAALPVLKQRIENERIAASAVIREMVAGEHRRLVGNICSRLIELHEANAAYHALADALNSEGVAWSALTPMHPRFLGSPLDSHGSLGSYLREAVDFGYLDAPNIPPTLKVKG